MTGPRKLRNVTAPPLRRVSVREPSTALRIYRPGRVARIFDVDNSTVWRWRKTGILPPPVRIGGIFGWTQAQLEEVLNRQEAGDE